MILDNKDDAAVHGQLAQAGAIRNKIDYGCFKLVVVDEEALGGRAALQALPVAPRDDQNLIAFIVQFVGPIQDAWLEALGETGADVITYVPSNAYVMRANAGEAIGLMQMKEQHPFVQWLGDYEPAYKLRPELDLRERFALMLCRA